MGGLNYKSINEHTLVPENSTSKQSIQILLLPTVFHNLSVPLNKMHPMTVKEAVQLHLGISC